MSGGGSKTQTTTSELKLPEWLNKGAESTFAAAQQAAAANPITAYTGPMAAGSNVNLDQASQMARQNTGTGQSDLDRARALTDAAATGTTGRVTSQDWNGQQASAYMNPYQQEVQQRTLDAMTRQNAIDNAALGDSMQPSKAYGGARHGVLEAEMKSGQNRNMLDYLAQSNKEGYNDAYSKFAGDRSSRMGSEATNASLSAQDLARQQSAGGQFAGIGGQAQQMTAEDINMLTRSGLIDQETANAMLQGDYNEFLRMQDAPMMRYMQLMQMLSGAPTDRSQTDVTKQKSGGGLFSSLLGAASVGASIFSDARLKENVKRVGKTDEGLGVYTYNYKGDGTPMMGVMAQEVERLKPQALGPEVAGYKTVNYAELGA